jgi:hypothetical protein
MQRLFSMFPGGMPGLGLIILRLCVVSSLLTIVSARGPFAFASWTGVGLGLLSLLMILGALTPAACTVGALIETLCLLDRQGTETRYIVFALLVSAALGLLGPGAFSVDARLFGRRLIVSNAD